MTDASHDCPGGCGRSVSRRLFACPGCWGALPRHLQTAITRHHRRDLAMHAQAMTTAIAWYRDQHKSGDRHSSDTEDGTP